MKNRAGFESPGRLRGSANAAPIQGPRWTRLSNFARWIDLRSESWWPALRSTYKHRIPHEYHICALTYQRYQLVACFQMVRDTNRLENKTASFICVLNWSRSTRRVWKVAAHHVNLESPLLAALCRHLRALCVSWIFVLYSLTASEKLSVLCDKAALLMQQWNAGKKTPKHQALQVANAFRHLQSPLFQKRQYFICNAARCLWNSPPKPTLKKKPVDAAGRMSNTCNQAAQQAT